MRFSDLVAPHQIHHARTCISFRQNCTKVNLGIWSKEPDENGPKNWSREGDGLLRRARGTEAASWVRVIYWFRAVAGLIQISSAGKTVPRHFERTVLVHPVRAGIFAAFAWAAQATGSLVRA
jgi:hypothetical protein